MADNASSRVNIDNIKVKVLGEKKGRYDLDSLPRLKYKKRDKPKYKRRTKAKVVLNLYSELSEVNEPSDLDVETTEKEAIVAGCDQNIDKIVRDHQNTYADVTDTLEDITSSDLLHYSQPMDTSQAVVCQISHQDTYVVEVCRSNALLPVNTMLTAFVLQDYDELLRQLKSKDFLLIRRSLHHFINGTVNWVYQCSCNPARSKIINSLHISIKEHYNQQLLADNPACVHCLVTERILDSLECFNGSLPFPIDPEESDPSSMDHDYLEHYQSYNVFHLPSVEVVCVYAERDYGFVGIDHKGFKCSTCNYDTHACSHIKFLEEKLSQDDVDLPDIVYEMYHQAKKQRKVNWKPYCLSDKSIQFQPPVHLQQIFGSSFYQSLPQENGTLHVVPRSSGVCESCGSYWSLQNPVEENWIEKLLLLYTMNKVIRAPLTLITPMGVVAQCVVLRLKQLCVMPPQFRFDVRWYYKRTLSTQLPKTYTKEDKYFIFHLHVDKVLLYRDSYFIRSSFISV
ncbi:uncharacterized protein LOC114544078 [Dendronephthya gigantea]|uniref:uncharacterized protein LOC114544078 n=1 Tax=Dendronephthya gigantea TaxID=151771 RepID=UPI00106A094D|nr:uncharacterized protein LOC114544078 [Dendronephthya gigantea]